MNTEEKIIEGQKERIERLKCAYFLVSPYFSPCCSFALWSSVKYAASGVTELESTKIKIYLIMEIFHYFCFTKGISVKIHFII